MEPARLPLWAEVVRGAIDTSLNTLVDDDVVVVRRDVRGEMTVGTIPFRSLPDRWKVAIQASGLRHCPRPGRLVVTYDAAGTPELTMHEFERRARKRLA